MSGSRGLPRAPRGSMELPAVPPRGLPPLPPGFVLEPQQAAPPMPQDANGPRYDGSGVPVGGASAPPPAKTHTLNIGGRKVTVDDTFMSLSPDEQNDTVDEIASSLGMGSGDTPAPPPGFVLEPQQNGPDLARIKRNVAKMAGMNAPEADIDGYIASEGTTIDAVRDFRPPQEKFGGAAMNATAGANETLYALAGAPVDLVRGGMNLASRGINAVAGTELPQIPENSFGGSQYIAESMGAIRPELDPQNTEAKSAGDRIARGVGQGVAGAVAPAGAVAGLSRAGVIGARATPVAEALFGRAGSGVDATLGAAGGAGAAVGQEIAPEGYGTAGALAGGMVGSVAGLAGIGAGQGLKTLAEPLYASGREGIAGRRLLAGATDPETFRQSVNSNPDQLVPGSQPTTFQQTGDLGIGVMEKAAANRAPDRFAQRRADQNGARVDALRGVAPDGAPEKVAATVRQRMDELEAETERLMGAATSEARDRTAAVGAPLTPEIAGGNMRAGIEAARAQAKARERALWSAVDPDGTLTLGLTNTRQSTAGIAKEMSGLAQPMTETERQIYGAIGQAGETVPFRALQDLKSNLRAAMTAERMTAGESPVYRRLSIVSAGLAKDIDDAVAGKVAQEAQAVAEGRMDVSQTLFANMQREQEAWFASRQATARGADGGGSSVGYGPGGQAPVPGVLGAAGEGTRRSGPASGDPRLPQDARGAGEGFRPVSLTELKSLGADDPYFVKSGDGQTFVPRVLGNGGERTPDLGTAPDLEAPGQDLPIRIRRSDMVKHVGNDVHQNDARSLGYGDSWEMVQDIAASWSQMRRGRYGRVQLVKRAQDGNGVAIVELAPSDDTTYWRVVSAHRNRDGQLGETILAREHTPSTSPGNDGSLVKRSPQGRQEAEFARDRIGPEYTADDVAGQAQSFDQAALDRLNAANNATRERASTFDNPTLGPIRQRPSSTSDYTAPAGVVPARIFNASPKSFEAIGQLRSAIGDKAATEAIQGYAVGEVLRAAGRSDGTIDAARLTAWRRTHANALRALPDLDAKLSDAARASEAIAEVSATRKAASDEASKGALGKLIGVDAPEDVTRIIGGVFSSQDAVARMGRIRQAIGSDPDAVKGLRRAVIEHMNAKFIGNVEVATSGAGGIRPDGFQRFVRDNAASLRAAGFDTGELRVLDAIAADLQRSGRSISGVKNPGGSDTAQNFMAELRGDTPFKAAARLLLAPGGVGLGIGATTSTTSGLAAGAVAGLLAAMRNAGLRTVDDLVTDALLNPDRARMLLSKVPAGQEQGLLRALSRSFGRSAAHALSGDKEKPPERGPIHLGALDTRTAKSVAIADALGLQVPASTSPLVSAVAMALNSKGQGPGALNQALASRARA